VYLSDRAEEKKTTSNQISRHLPLRQKISGLYFLNKKIFFKRINLYRDWKNSDDQLTKRSLGLKI